ncbi:MAG TPA: hypothetical protein VL326_09500 [Kofleriaceae bacterium]|nr:hypothetical protein [Kofleriaceae bacterium]
MRRLGVVLFLVGCGSVAAKPDAGNGSGDSGGMGDASPDGPSVGDATVQVQLAGVATGGLKVNFQEADGSLAGEATTDTAGSAKATVHQNAMVTVAVSSKLLITITGVNPGETVLLKTPKPYDGSIIGTVTFGTSTEAPNKSYYRADIGNDQYVTVTTMTTGTRSLNLKQGNLDGNGKFNMYAGTYDAQNHLISYTFLTNITPTGSSTAVTLPNNWRTDLNEFALMMTGAPTGATNLSATTWSEQANAQFAGTDFGTPITPDSVALSAGNGSINQRYAASFGDFIQTNANVSFGTTKESVAFWRRVPRPAGAYTLGSNDFPARIGGLALDKSTPTRPVANWTVTGSTVNGDATIINVDWKDTSNVAYSWLVYTKPDATSFTFPTLSSSLAAQAPAQSTYTELMVTQTNLEPMAGYGAFHLAPLEANINTYPMPVGFTAWAYDSMYLLNP